MLRTSSYTIYVDLPGKSDEMLLVHGYSGAYDRVSRPVASYVRSLEVRRPPKPLYGVWRDEPAVDGNVPIPSDETLEILRRRGYLTEMSVEAEEDFLVRLAGRLHEKQWSQVPTYIFIPTYDCNLRCAYCFQDAMRTDAKHGHLLRLMQPELIERTVAALPQIEELHGLSPKSGPHHRNVGFFGGEPLLAASRPAVAAIIDRVLDLGTADFWAVTNATELAPYEDLLGPGRISEIQVTLDGPPREHDRRRIYADGSGSFAVIANNISRALELGVRVSLRLNLDRINLTGLFPLADEIQARGWDAHPSFSTYTAPVRPENDNVDRATTFNSWELDVALAELAETAPHLRMFARPDDGMKERARRIFEAPETNRASLRESYCSAHTRMYLFDAFGDIYACWERTGDPGVRIGHIAADGALQIQRQVSDLWRTRTVATNPVCRRCRYALYCGGGCAVLAAGKTGKYHSNYCDGFADRLRASVAEAYAEYVDAIPRTERGGRVCDQ